MRRILAASVFTIGLLCSALPAVAQTLQAAVLPSSRSTTVGHPVTAFATIANTGATVATACQISTTLPNLQLVYQTTNKSTNQVTGSPNTPVDIQPGAAQTFIITLTPSAPMQAVDVALTLTCSNTQAAPIISGLNTLLLTAATITPPDIIALVATVTNDGILDLANETDSKAFAVAAINIGAPAQLTVKPDPGDLVNLPVTVTICQTNQAGARIAPPTPTVNVSLATNATVSFAVFVTATGPVPFKPDAERIRVIFVDANGVIRGGTSVAVRTHLKSHPGALADGIYLGIWRVTSSASNPVLVAAVVSETGEFHLLPAVQRIMRQTLQIQTFPDLTLTATGTAYAPGAFITPATGPVVANGIFGPQSHLVISYQTGNERGLFNLNYMKQFYKGDSDLVHIAGGWVLRDENFAANGSVTVNRDGTLTGTTGAGCGLTGSVSLLDTGFNLYRITINVGACQGAGPATFTGLTTFQNKGDLGDKQGEDENENENNDDNRKGRAAAQGFGKEFVIEASNATASFAGYLTGH